MKRKAIAWLHGGHIKAGAKYLGKAIKGSAWIQKPVCPKAWVIDETNIQSNRYILRSSERYLLRDSSGNVLCFVP